MFLLFSVCVAATCAWQAQAGFLIKAIETDLVSGDCSSNGTGVHLDLWTEGVSYSNSATEDGYLAIEYNGTTAYCCWVPELDLTNEFPCTTPPSPPPSCPDGFEQFEGNCFMFSSRRSSWGEARKFCTGKGGYLARPDTVANFFIIGSIKNTKLDHWFDLNKKNIDKWQYSDRSKPKQKYWAAGKPHTSMLGLLGKEECVAYDHKKEFMWSNYKCTDKKRFICEAKLS